MFVLGVELAMYVVYCLVSLATLAAAVLLWGMRLRGSLPAFLGSWALTMLSTLSVGLLVGGVAKDTKQASVSLPPSSISPCSSFPARRFPSRSCRRLCRRSSVSFR